MPIQGMRLRGSDGPAPAVALAEVAGFIPGRSALGAWAHWKGCGSCGDCRRAGRAAEDFARQFGLLGLSWVSGDLGDLVAVSTRNDHGAERLDDFIYAAALVASWLESYSRRDYADFLLLGPPIAPGQQEQWREYRQVYLPHPGLLPVVSHAALGADMARIGPDAWVDDSPIFKPMLTVPTLWVGLHVSLLLDLWGGQEQPARCARPDCGRLFVRSPASERGAPRIYCSKRCGDVMRHRRARTRATATADASDTARRPRGTVSTVRPL
jgi:hypothetical protein